MVPSSGASVYIPKSNFLRHFWILTGVVDSKLFFAPSKAQVMSQAEKESEREKTHKKLEKKRSQKETQTG